MQLSLRLQTMKVMDEIFDNLAGHGVKCIAMGREGSRDLLITASVDGTMSVRDMNSSVLIRSISGHSKTPLDLQVIFG